MIGRLLCLLGRHDWEARVVTVAVLPLHHGYVAFDCVRCDRRRRISLWR